MVNVPGRSQGCQTCRRRKKGCDLAKPTCDRCAKEGYTCAGYGHATIWVEYEPKRRSSPARTSPKPRSKESQALIFRFKEVPEIRKEHVYCDNLTQGLARSQAEQGILYQFIDAYFPDSVISVFDAANTADWLIRWKGTIAKMSTTDPLLTRTVAALGLALIGQRSTDATMSRQGVKLYSTVLLQLTEILRGPRGAAVNPDLLTSVLLMGLWEQFNGFSAVGAANQGRGWHAHTQGMKRLLETRGPHGFADDRAFLVLQAAQTSQFTAAFAARKGTSLASHAWRTAPWTHRQKSPRDRFFDIAFRLPGLVEDADLAIASGSASEGLRLLSELHQMLVELIDWKDSLQSYIDPIYFGGADDVYPNPFNLDTTQLHNGLLYCSAVIHVIILLNNLTSTLATTEFSYLRADVPDIVPYAIWILQAIPVSMQDGGICGSQSTLFPTGAVRWCIMHLRDSRPDNVLLLEALLANSRKEMGYKNPMDGFLGNICDIRARVPPVSMGCES